MIFDVSEYSQFNFFSGSLEVKELRREKQDLVATITKVTGEKHTVEAENEKIKVRLSELEGKSKQWDNIYVENNKLKTKQTELEKRIQVGSRPTLESNYNYY